MPPSTAVPAPVLARLPLPLITPLTVSCVPVTSSVPLAPSAMAPPALALPLLLASAPPDRVIALVASVRPLRSRAPPLPMVTPARSLPMAATSPMRRVPPLMVVVPL